MNYIKRSIESTIKEVLNDPKPTLFVGARQTGKSTILQQICPEYNYVSFDDPFKVDQTTTSPNLFLSLNQPPVILDEVHRAPRLSQILGSQEDMCGPYFLTSSLPFRLPKSLTDQLRVIEIPALSLREILCDSFSEPFLPTWEYMAHRPDIECEPDSI